MYDQIGIDKADNTSNTEDQSWFDKKTNWGSGFHITMNKEQIAKKFDRHAQNWTLFVEKSKYTPVFDWIKENAPQLPNKNGDILDLACGVGLIGKSLRENGVTGRIHGVDISTEMLAHTLKTKCFDGGVRWADLDEPLPFSVNEKFDLITCFGTSEMLSDIQSFLQNVHHLLRNSQSQFWLSMQLDEGHNNPTGHQGLKQYTIKAAHKMLAHAGYEIVNWAETPAAYYIPSPDGKEPAKRVPYMFFNVHTLK
eukprot:Phypoly_transcript_10356.p1 GENE.Phypoly_transcript_10356~~Phypoly_transcript_10356.p1  ORF type:complete len:252 (-),score=42.49 Phypoly_transcript_10356:14-769(-)